MSNRETLKDFDNVTFSQASVDGLTHSGWLVGPMTDRSGQDLVLARVFLLLAEVMDSTMNEDSFGTLFIN